MEHRVKEKEYPQEPGQVYPSFSCLPPLSVPFAQKPGRAHWTLAARKTFGRNDSETEKLFRSTGVGDNAIPTSYTDISETGTVMVEIPTTQGQAFDPTLLHTRLNGVKNMSFIK